MINKQNLWFITLFSLILILGIYYATIPHDSIEVFSDNTEKTSETIEVKESDVIIAMKVEEEEKMLSEMDNAKKILLDNKASAEDKNLAYENLQALNNKKGKLTEIEKLLKDKYDIDVFVKIDGNKINITIPGENKGEEYANNIIRTIQSLYENQMYITVNFKK